MQKNPPFYKNNGFFVFYLLIVSLLKDIFNLNRIFESNALYGIVIQQTEKIYRYVPLIFTAL